MSVVVDTFVAYKFLELLTTPWEETEAFKLGIIDNRGNVLIRRRNLKTSQQRRAYTIFHRLVWNIKRLLDRLPPTRTRMGSFAAAMWMLKEHEMVTDGAFQLMEESLEEILAEHNVQRPLLTENAELPPGKYVLGEQTLHVMEKTQPVGHCLGCDVYKFDNVVFAIDDKGLVQ